MPNCRKCEETPRLRIAIVWWVIVIVGFRGASSSFRTPAPVFALGFNRSSCSVGSYNGTWHSLPSICHRFGTREFVSAVIFWKTVKDLFHFFSSGAFGGMVAVFAGMRTSFWSADFV